MEPAIFDPSSPWFNLWLIVPVAIVVGWAFFIAAALMAAALMPYLVGRLVGSWVRARSGTGTGSKPSRALVPAVVAVIILMVTVVIGLAYGVGAAKEHDLSGQPNPPSTTEAALNHHDGHRKWHRPSDL